MVRTTKRASLGQRMVSVTSLWSVALGDEVRVVNVLGYEAFLYVVSGTEYGI